MNHELHSDYDLVFESDEIEHNFAYILVSQEKIYSSSDFSIHQVDIFILY